MIFHFYIFLLVAYCIGNCTMYHIFFYKMTHYLIDEGFSSTVPIKTSHDKEITEAENRNISFRVS